MKKLFLLLIFLFSIFFINSPTICFAEDDIEEQSIQQELNNAADEQLSSFDFSGLEDSLDGLGENEKKVFGSSSF